MHQFVIFAGVSGVCVFCLFFVSVLLCSSGVVPLDCANPTSLQSCVCVVARLLIRLRYKSLLSFGVCSLHPLFGSSSILLFCLYSHRVSI
uniref:Uncharacterized protein n=1 Tax=Anopheles darlingi TaxID=43151 RepID=A0A2M4D525_ANODA